MNCLLEACAGEGCWYLGPGWAGGSIGTGGGEKGVGCLVSGENNTVSSWRDDVYDGTGYRGIEINVFYSIAVILGSITSSLFTTCNRSECIAWRKSKEKREYKQQHTHTRQQALYTQNHCIWNCLPRIHSCSMTPHTITHLPWLLATFVAFPSCSALIFHCWGGCSFLVGKRCH